MSHARESKKQIVDRIKSMSILCMYSHNPDPIPLSAIEYIAHESESYCECIFYLC